LTSTAIVHGDRIVHFKGFGKADNSGRAVTPQTSFILGSVSKSFTALTVMQLVEAGKVQLDAPVQRYILWFQVADPVASAMITVRQLLNQTSGLPASAGNSIYDGPAAQRIEHAVRGLQTVQLDRPIGSSFEYIDINYVVLGAWSNRSRTGRSGSTSSGTSSIR
jgi:CubicO group peptidase (beta-lactamase class C family)